MLKCGEEDRHEARLAELARSTKNFALLIPSLRTAMVPAFATHLGQDIAPEHQLAAENDFGRAHPGRLLGKFNRGSKEIDEEG